MQFKSLFLPTLLGCFLFFFSLDLRAQEPVKTNLWVVESVDGNLYTGELIKQSTEEVLLKTDALGEITIRKNNIRSMKLIEKEEVKNGIYWPENPHATRYFFGPNGYSLRKGEGYYQNTWIFFNQFSYGITDNFTLGAGFIPTFLFGGGEVFPFWITPKVSFPIQKNKVNVGVGAMYINALVSDDDNTGGGVGMVYGISTFGSRQNNFTVGLGYGFAGDEWADRPTINLGGMTRTGRNHYLMAELYFLDGGEENVNLLMFGGRWTGRRIAIDYGLVRPIISDTDGFFAFPWLGINVPLGNTTRRPD